MLKFVRKNWFLLGVLVVIFLGLILGTAFNGSSQLHQAVRFLPSGGVTAVILFLMSFSLDSRKIVESLKSPAPVLFAIAINAILLPAVCLLVMKLQLRIDLMLGLLIAIVAPSTMATASVFTRQAAGNDAVSLLVTLVTNSVCIFIVPFWLFFGGLDGVTIDAGLSNQLIVKLIWIALLPSILGQAVRVFHVVRVKATQHRKQLGTLAQLGILILIFKSVVLNAEALLPKQSTGLVSALFWCWLWCAAIHILGLIVGWWGSFLFRFSPENRIAIAFSGSQKTLAIPVLLATDASLFGTGEFPLVVFPILVYHASQLVIDTLLIPPFAASVVASVAVSTDSSIEPNKEPNK